MPGRSFILQIGAEHAEMRRKLCTTCAQLARRFLLSGGVGAVTETTQTCHQPGLEEGSQSQGGM